MVKGTPRRRQLSESVAKSWPTLRYESVGSKQDWRLRRGASSADVTGASADVMGVGTGITGANVDFTGGRMRMPETGALVASIHGGIVTECVAKEYSSRRVSQCKTATNMRIVVT